MADGRPGDASGIADQQRSGEVVDASPGIGHAATIDRASHDTAGTTVSPAGPVATSASPQLDTTSSLLASEALISAVPTTFEARVVAGLDDAEERASGSVNTTSSDLELTFDGTAGTVAYRWRADERAFAMPIKVGDPSRWQLIRPTADWQLMPTTLTPETFKVATDLYYVEVAILDANGRPVK